MKVKLMAGTHACSRCPIFAALCALSIVAGASSAQAAPSASDKLTAKALFEAGRALTKANNFADACPKLLESHQLDPSLVTEFFLADCYEHTGQIASAWVYYDDVANQALAAGQTDRGTFARGRADALKPRVPKLTIEVPVEMKGWPDLTIKRDQKEVSRAQWGLTIAVDPTRYAVSAEATGRKRWSVIIDVKEGTSEVVKVPVLDQLGGAAVKPPVAAPVLAPPRAQPVAPPIATPPKAQPIVAPPIAPPTAHPTPSGTGWTQRTTGFVISAAGLVGLGIGAGFGALAMSKHDASKAPERCDAQNRCDKAGLALQDDAFRAATVSSVGVILGGVALAGGVVLILTAPRQPRSTKLSLGPGSISLARSW
jgi:hypothetical protein